MKGKSHICRFGGAGLITLFFFILQGVCFAGMAVSPLQQTVDVKPGKKAAFSITVSNNIRGSKARPCPIKVNVLDFQVSDTGQLLFGPEYKHPRSAAAWIKMEPNEIVLQPGESREMKATVTAPMNADGDYWAAAMIELGEPQKGEKGVQVKLRTASGIFIHVARRNYAERGNITDVNVAMPEFDANDNSIEKNASEGELYKLKEKQSLKIEAKLKNNGLIAILARGKAYVYSEDWRKIATIPLHASRRQVLPGDNRWFKGIMAEPLPAGNYKLRIFLASDEKFKRKMTKDAEFTVSRDLAEVWAKNFTNDGTTKLKFQPQQFKLKLNPGRLTAETIQVTNQGLNTVTANCRIEGNGTSDDWIELKTTDLTLAPNSQNSITYKVKVPSDAKPGTYNWTILVETEHSGLESQGQNVEQYKIPVFLVIDKNARVITDK